MRQHSTHAPLQHARRSSRNRLESPAPCKSNRRADRDGVWCFSQFAHVPSWRKRAVVRHDRYGDAVMALGWIGRPASCCMDSPNAQAQATPHLSKLRIRSPRHARPMSRMWCDCAFMRPAVDPPCIKLLDHLLIGKAGIIRYSRSCVDEALPERLLHLQG